MATAIQTVETNQPPIAKLGAQLEQRIPEFKKALPSHIPPEKLQRTIMTAAMSNPDLLAADRQSLITSCMKAAQDGLLPDGREAALVIFSTRVKDGQGKWISIKQVQYMPMVFGLRKKILQSGEISAIETNVVYRKEAESGAFYYEAGTDATLRHRPMLDLTDEESADGEIVAAYSVAVMKDGTKSFEVMRRSEINKVRQVSQTGALGKTKYNSSEAIPAKGPWVDWFGEMARKTVMRRHSKTLPMSGDIIDVEGRDEEIAIRSTQDMLDREPDAPRLVPPTRDEAGQGHDPETGEIARDDDDEETARQLDAETEARSNGMLDDENPTATEGPDDSQRGESHTAGGMADEIIARVEKAEVIADVLAIEADYQANLRGMLDVADQDRIETSIGDAKLRLKGGAK